MAPMFALVSAPERKMPNGTSGSALRRSMATNPASATTTAANEPIVLSRPPPGLLGGHDGVDQQQHRAGDGDRAGDVELAAAAGDLLAARDEPDRGDQREQRHRGRHQQRQPPADLGQQARQDQAERESARPERGVDADGPVAHRALAEGGGEQRQPGRGGEGGRDALDEPGPDQQLRAADEPAEQRRDREHGQRGEEHPAPPEQVGGPAAEQQQAAVAEHVAADHPLQRGRGQPEGGADVGQGDADHRNVEPVEEQRSAEHDQDGPQTRAPVLRVRSLGVA